jgi:hypothetical protein
MTARPSSTSALALLFIPFWAVIAGAAGFVLGLAARGAWKSVPSERQNQKRHSWVLPSLLAFILVGASTLGAFHAGETEKAAEPRVIVDAAKLDRAFAAATGSRIREAKQVYKADPPSDQVGWGPNTTELLYRDSQVQLRDRGSNRNVVVSTAALDYITRVYAVPVALAAYAQPSLAIVITGRATGRRAIVLVLAPDYEVLLEERIYRCWHLDSPAIDVRSDQSNKSEAIVVGPTCETPLVIRSRKAV